MQLKADFENRGSKKYTYTYINRQRLGGRQREKERCKRDTRASGQ